MCNRLGTSMAPVFAIAIVLLMSGIAGAQWEFYVRSPYTSSPTWATAPPPLPPLSADAYAGAYTYPEGLAATTVPLRSRVFMTSLNYPGVYGMYYNGPGGGMTPIVSASGVLMATYEDASRLARIELRVPADADMWVNGRKLTDIGTLRRIVSPPLLPGREYEYEIQARWLENGRMVDRSQRYVLSAGESIYSDWTVPREERALTPRGERTLTPRLLPPK